MAAISAAVEQALKAANVPFVNVSLPDHANRATWTVVFQPTATAQDRVTAQGILDTVDVSQSVLDDADATAAFDAKDLTAAIRAVWEAIPAPARTLAQVRSRAIAIRKALG